METEREESIRIYLIRHLATRGNFRKEYIGSTDEDLSEEGKAAAAGRIYPPCGILFASPMKRCLQTAAICYPGRAPVILQDLRECDFGHFEARNYEDMADDPEYRGWVDSGGRNPFPGGESLEAFGDRCVKAFGSALRETQKRGLDSAAFVVHGGTIMALLDRLSDPKGDYFSWACENGGGFSCVYRDGRLREAAAVSFL